MEYETILAQAQIHSLKSAKWKKIKDNRNKAVNSIITRSSLELKAKLENIYKIVGELRQQLIRAKTISEVESISCEINV